MATIGVLALQGGFAAHARMLARLGHRVVEVRSATQLSQVAGLVLPGGESTTQLKLIDSSGLRAPLNAFVEADLPVLATCAGLILAAREVSGPKQPSFGWLDVAVQRNAYGRQLDSFEACSDSGLPLMFIRAPRIITVGDDAEVVDRYQGEPIMVRAKGRRFYGATYHPELTESDAVHRSVFGVA